MDKHNRSEIEIQYSTVVTLSDRVLFRENGVKTYCTTHGTVLYCVDRRNGATKWQGLISKICFDRSENVQ